MMMQLGMTLLLLQKFKQATVLISGHDIIMSLRSVLYYSCSPALDGSTKPEDRTVATVNLERLLTKI